MSEEEKEAIEELKRTIKNSNFCDNIGIGQIEIILNYIDKLQRREEIHRDTIRYCLDIMSEYDTDILKLQKENEKLKEDKAVLSKEILTDKTKIVLLKQENEELKRKTYKALDYIEENSFEDTTGVVLNLKDENYWELWKILKGE